MAEKKAKIRPLSVNEVVWARRNGVVVYPPEKKGNQYVEGGKYLAILNIGLISVAGKEFEADKAEGRSPKEAVQKICNQNNMLSPWEIASLKKALSTDAKRKN